MHNCCTLFFRGDAAFEASIEGPVTQMQRVTDKLSGEKAQLVRANGDEIRSVTWFPVAAEEEDEG